MVWVGIDGCSISLICLWDEGDGCSLDKKTRQSNALPSSRSTVDVYRRYLEIMMAFKVLLQVCPKGQASNGFVAKLGRIEKSLRLALSLPADRRNLFPFGCLIAVEVLRDRSNLIFDR